MSILNNLANPVKRDYRLKREWNSSVFRRKASHSGKMCGFWSQIVSH